MSTNTRNLTAGGTILNCTGCCTSCGLHFASQRAFDKHRQGEYEITTESGQVLKENTRQCVDPNTIPGLENYLGKCPRTNTGNEPVFLWRLKDESKEDTRA